MQFVKPVMAFDTLVFIFGMALDNLARHKYRFQRDSRDSHGCAD